eukprot:gene20481-24579_t
MGDVYQEILREQVKQGNFGGKKGPFAYLTKEKKQEKASKYSKMEGYKLHKITLDCGIVQEATDTNGQSDPYCRIGRISPKLFQSKWLHETKADPKTLVPVWEETFEVYLNKTGKDKFLILQLWDRDMLKDDFIGSCIIDMSTISDYTSIYTHSVYKKPEDFTPSGSVTVKYQVI